MKERKRNELYNTMYMYVYAYYMALAKKHLGKWVKF